MRLRGIGIVCAFVGLGSVPAGAQCWERSAELTQAAGSFGNAVANDGDTLLVGNASFQAKGSAWIYERDGGGTWQQVAQLVSPSVRSTDRFGWAVSLSGDTAVVSARDDDASISSSGQEGAVYVFERDLGGAEAWGEAARLLASDGRTGDRFGTAVSIRGDRLAVGADGATVEAFDDAGVAYLFERDQGGPRAWGEVTRLTPPIPSFQGGFGLSIAVAGDTLLVGSPHTDGDLAGSGVAHVFQRSGGTGNPWLLTATLNPEPQALSAEFGQSVALFGDEALVGAWRDRTAGVDTGSAYLFERDRGGPEAWGLARELVPHDGQANDRFGAAVALTAERIVVGASLDNVGTATADGVFGLAIDPNAGVLYGAYRSGTLVTVDPATGLDTPVGETGQNGMESLAFDPGASVLYGCNFFTGQLLTIDTGTAAATVVGSTGGYFIRGMAYDPGAGVLYGVHDQPEPDLLVSIDPAAGNATPIGGIGHDNVHGLGFDSRTGKLYASTDGTGAAPFMVIEIDPASGASTVVGDSPLQLLPLEGMAGDAPGGTMYGTQDEILPAGGDACLSTVDPTTGAVTPYFSFRVGSAYVYGRDFGGRGAWGLDEKLDGSVVSQGGFGSSLSLSGATVAVGAPARKAVELWDPLPAGAVSYCTAGTSASGCRASLSACGVPSASAADGFRLRASPVEGGTQGLFLFSTHGRQANSWGNGSSFQCLVPPWSARGSSPRRARASRAAGPSRRT